MSESIIIIIVLLCLFFGFNSKIIRENEAMVIERTGRLSRVLYQGIHFIVPCIEAPRKYIKTVKEVGLDGKVYNKFISSPIVDLKEILWDSSNENAITDDGETISFSMLLYFKIVDPVKAVYMVENLFDAVGNVASGTMKKLVSEYKVDEIFDSIDTIKTNLKDTLIKATHSWGIKITNVELPNINVYEDNFNNVSSRI